MNFKEGIFPEPISIIGMTGCGKTSVGKELARLLNCDFFDSDYEILNCFGISAGELLTDCGEEAMRRKEYEVIKKLCRRGFCVISTGGGAPTLSETFNLLKTSTIPVRVTRNSFPAPACPPVFGNAEKYESILREREPIYSSLAIYTAENTFPADCAADIALYLHKHYGF